MMNMEDEVMSCMHDMRHDTNEKSGRKKGLELRLLSLSQGPLCPSCLGGSTREVHVTSGVTCRVGDSAKCTIQAAGAYEHGRDVSVGTSALRLSENLRPSAARAARIGPSMDSHFPQITASGGPTVPRIQPQ